MPVKEVVYASAHESLKEPQVITTSLGNMILEIQGELILPSEKPDITSIDDESKYSKLLSDEQWAVKFGRLEINGKKATLFIGTSQRLLGDVKTLDPPLALMKFPSDSESDEPVDIVDVIRHKIIFTGRPLPIM